MKCQVTNYDVLFNLMDSIRLFRILVFPSSKLGTRGIEGMRGRLMHGMPKINLGIHGFVGRDYVIEESYCGPSNFTFQ